MPWAMIGMVVGPDHRVDVGRRRRRAAAREGPGWCRRGSGCRSSLTRIETRRRRFLGSAGSHSPQSLPTRGTPTRCRSRGCGPSRRPLRLGEQAVEIGAWSARRELLDRLAAQRGEEAGGVGDEGRLAGAAAVRAPARGTANRSRSAAGRAGCPRAVSCRSARVLEGDDARDRDVEAERQHLVGEIRGWR